MKYEQKGSVISSPSARPINDQDAKQIGDVPRVRKIVLILLVLKLMLILIYFSGKLFDFVGYSRMPKDLRDDTVSWGMTAGTIGGIISIIYLIIFIIFVIKFLRRGILIFAWFAIIDLVLVILLIVFTILRIIIQSSAEHVLKLGIFLTVVLIIGAIVGSLFTVLTILYSFKLAKLIKIQGEYRSV